MKFASTLQGLQSQKAEKIYLIKNVLHLYFLPSHTVSRAASGTALGINRRCEGDTDFGTALADRRRPEAPISPGSILARRREAKPAFERIHECCFQILICKIANFELQRREPLPSLLTGLNGRYCAVRLPRISLNCRGSAGTSVPLSGCKARETHGGSRDSKSSLRRFLTSTLIPKWSIERSAGVGSWCAASRSAFKRLWRCCLIVRIRQMERHPRICPPRGIIPHKLPGYLVEYAFLKNLVDASSGGKSTRVVSFWYNANNCGSDRIAACDLDRRKSSKNKSP